LIGHRILLPQRLIIVIEPSPAIMVDCGKSQNPPVQILVAVCRRFHLAARIGAM
jgi:hypothetical protein